jgi:hypothetical protein
VGLRMDFRLGECSGGHASAAVVASDHSQVSPTLLMGYLLEVLS